MTDTAQRIADWVRANTDRVGLPPGEPKVSLIGTGESYAAWLVRVADADPLVVRIPRRPVEQLPRPMAAEMAGLVLVPPGLGPRAVLFEESADSLGVPFLVTGYVPGREVSVQDWDDALLLAHARQLAALHATPFTAAGEVTAAERDRTPRLSLTARLADSLDWWRGAHPDVLGDPEVARLVPAVQRHITEAEPAFARLRRFALIHGDLVASNILVDAGTPRYVDWEWVEIGDPAQDLAYIGGLVAAPPWYIQLTSEQIDRFLNAYVVHAGEAAEPVTDLRVRRDAFEIFERFFSSLHFRTQRGNEEDRRSGRYTEAVRLLTAGLQQALG
ncbi:phosphotransferase family protein [Kibdelosporangium aridum]|uniref:Phosphotransferase enzyme family protein n=1 Tax=Kibdelosporangium aridum TaxID=2030 RepID=A0A1W2AZT0_KIBAR|nr:phosphotransferase [Kibdelosporangium aridum]SMC65972.1 Phosphotransferase enzyme family protein [Kibdelosporangium aridum]